MRQVLWESLGRTVHLVEMVDQEIREIRVKGGRMVKIRFVPAATLGALHLKLDQPIRVNAQARNSTPVTLLHGYANPLKRLDTSESVNSHKCLILLDSCRIHATSVDAPFRARENIRNAVARSRMLP